MHDGGQKSDVTQKVMLGGRRFMECELMLRGRMRLRIFEVYRYPAVAAPATTAATTTATEAAISTTGQNQQQQQQPAARHQLIEW